MTGPIYVEGAKPGDMLEVRYLRMMPRCSYGSNLAANWGYLYKEFGEKERVTIYALDANSNQAEALFAYDFPGKYLVPGTITHCPDCDRQPALQGVRVPVRPHLGTAGVAPDVDGPRQHHPARRCTAATSTTGASAPARRCTIRCRSTAPCSRSAIRTSARATASSPAPRSRPRSNVLFQIVLRKDFSFPSPLLETPKYWIVHGFDEDLNVAMRDASLDMLRLLTDHSGLSRNDAYSLMSVAADFAVTQVVDGRQGVHVRIPRSIFPARGAPATAE